MTSRTTPVGILVVALVSLSTIGCNAQTSAVFEALVDPLGAPASPSEAVAAPTDAAVDPADQMWWPHPDGYAMVLPAGWAGVAVDDADADQLMDAVEATSPVLAERMQSVLLVTGSRISAIAVGTVTDAGLVPLLVVLAQPTEDRGAHAIKSLVKEQIAGLPGLSAGPFRDDVTLPAAKGVQFDFGIEDPDLGTLQVRSYLFRFASEAYLVSFVATAEGFEAAEPMFELIAASLRFGV
jgi:hypothetical protein